MTYQLSVAVRNAQLDQFETTVGTGPKLQLRTGAQPADCASASTGTLLAEITLPSDWMNNASSGSKTKLGTWSVAATAAGNIAHFRIFDSTGTTCHAQGSVTATGGGGDMTVDNVNIAVAQVVTVNTYSVTMGNA